MDQIRKYEEDKIKFSVEKEQEDYKNKQEEIVFSCF